MPKKLDESGVAFLWNKIKSFFSGTVTPSMDGTAKTGTSQKFAREDHTHPTDTSRAPKYHASTQSTYGTATDKLYGHVILTDIATASLPAESGTGYAATPKAVKDAIDATKTFAATELPLMDSTEASVGTSNKYAREDHVHERDIGVIFNDESGEVGIVNYKLDSNRMRSVYTADEVDTMMSFKVNTETGKRLSTEDYTTEEKNKLDTVTEGAEPNQNAYGYITVYNKHDGSEQLPYVSEAGSEIDGFILIGGRNITLSAHNGTSGSENCQITIDGNEPINAYYLGWVSATGEVEPDDDLPIADGYLLSATFPSDPNLALTIVMPSGFYVTGSIVWQDSKVVSASQIANHTALLLCHQHDSADANSYAFELLALSNTQDSFEFYSGFDETPGSTINDRTLRMVHTVTDPLANRSVQYSYLMPRATPTSAGVMNSLDKAKLDGIAEGAEVNQNAFSFVNAGGGGIEASAKTDTLYMASGSGISIEFFTDNTMGSSSFGKTYLGIYGKTATTSEMGMMSALDKIKLNGIDSGAEVNQNAFGKIKVGSTVIEADDKTDTLEIAAGYNINITPSATDDKVTISADIPGEATSSTTGLMSASDKAKLDFIQDGAAAVGLVDNTTYVTVTAEDPNNGANSADLQKHLGLNTAGGLLRLNSSAKIDSEYLPDTNVSINRKVTSGTNIADITIDGTTTQLYAPTGGGGGSAYTAGYSGFGYAACSTAAATAAKSASIDDYDLIPGTYVTIRFTNAVPANATLNISSKGAKPIYCKNAAIKANVIKAGDTCLFVYDGSYYRLIAKDTNIELSYSVVSTF